MVRALMMGVLVLIPGSALGCEKVETYCEIYRLTRIERELGKQEEAGKCRIGNGVEPVTREGRFRMAFPGGELQSVRRLNDEAEMLEGCAGERPDWAKWN